jgi:hypothetical protein
MLFARIALFVCASGVCFAQYLDTAAKNDAESALKALGLVHEGSLADRGGHFLQASGYYERAAAMLEHSRGPNDNATVSAIHRFADASINLGLYAKAERLLRRVLLAREEGSDADAALTAALNDLALVYIAHVSLRKQSLWSAAPSLFSSASR